MEENIGYLQGIELLVVSTLLQLLIELGASYYPSHNFSHTDAIHKYDT